MFTYIFTVFSKLFHIILGIGTPQNYPPPLSAEEEKENFIKLATGDDKARETLILHNLRLVSHLVRKYYSSYKSTEDLISIGTIGLVKAVDSFRHSTGTRFATYAAKCIQNEILMYFRSQNKLNNEVSINETIDVDRDGNPLTYIDIISCDDNVCENIYLQSQIKKAMHGVENLLSQRERQIIILRYGLSGKRPMAQREIAVLMNISRSYVSRIEKAALEKLRAYM